MEENKTDAWLKVTLNHHTVFQRLDQRPDADGKDSHTYGLSGAFGIRSGKIISDPIHQHWYNAGGRELGTQRRQHGK